LFGRALVRGPSARIRGDCRSYLCGLAHRIAHFGEPAQSFLWLIVGALLVGYAVFRNRHDPLTPIVVAYAIFACFMGTLVWDYWGNFGRALEPVYAYGLVVLLGGILGRTRAVANANT
jgi:hypothetical protein